ncbi:MAG: cupin domain-containing protein [Chloroflexi bacterium]|nr:cupin domain-containing protein [Chloroflexota bacterium]
MRRSLLALALWLPIGAAVWLLDAGRPASAQSLALPTTITSVTLAARFLDEAPSDRRWVLRRRHPLNDDAHAHAPGFIYAASGSSYLVIDDGQGLLMPEGTAAWVPGGIGHLHTSSARATSAGGDPAAGLEVWAILLERDTEARAPGAAVVSPPAIGLVAGPYEARLTTMTFAAGAMMPLARRTGPELAYALSGDWELEYIGVPFTLGRQQGYVADPGVPYRLRNAGASPARLLSAQLVPAGQPAAIP